MTTTCDMSLELAPLDDTSREILAEVEAMTMQGGFFDGVSLLPPVPASPMRLAVATRAARPGSKGHARLSDILVATVKASR